MYDMYDMCVLLSDIHGQLPSIPKDRPIIISGDLSFTEKGDVIAEAVWYENELMPWLEKFPSVLMTAGNHDFLPERYRRMFEDMLPSNTTFGVAEVKEWQGYRVGLLAYTPPFWDWAFQGDEEFLWRVLQSFGRTEILVSHGPPYGIGDTVCENNERLHVGSKALLKYIDEYRPRLVVCGHIHAGRGIYQRGKTLIVNASSVDEDYTLVDGFFSYHDSVNPDEVFVEEKVYIQ